MSTETQLIDTEIVEEVKESASGEINKSIYTPDELAIFEKTKQVRLDIVNSMTQNGVPYKAGDIRVLNEVMTSLDKNVQDSASNRLKYQENQNKDAAADMVATLFKEISRNKQQHVRPHAEVFLPDEHLPEDMVYGETAINPEKLELEYFVRQDEEN